MSELHLGEHLVADRPGTSSQRSASQGYVGLHPKRMCNPWLQATDQVKELASYTFITYFIL